MSDQYIILFLFLHNSFSHVILRVGATACSKNNPRTRLLRKVRPHLLAKPKIFFSPHASSETIIFYVLGDMLRTTAMISRVCSWAGTRPEPAPCHGHPNPLCRRFRALLGPYRTIPYLPHFLKLPTQTSLLVGYHRLPSTTIADPIELDLLYILSNLPLIVSYDVWQI